ncbi:MAG: cell envelope integrity protein CreD, partial [Ferruginibacter sp.]
SGFCCLIYSILFIMLSGYYSINDKIIYGSSVFAFLIGCVSIAFIFSSSNLNTFFNSFYQSSINKKQMEPLNSEISGVETRSKSNRILIKAGITGALILLLLIPTIFVSNLVTERKLRQIEVVNEVSNKWAQPQTLTGPYIYLPYKIQEKTTDNKIREILNHLIILPDMLNVNGDISHEIRLRSIYKVLLYRASLNNSGNFQVKIPKEIDSNLVQWQDAKICYGISDFKGIEEKLIVNFNGNDLELSPGLPSNEISIKGLSAPINLTPSEDGKTLAFNMNLKIKGSEQLHFIPLAGDSKFSLKSGWASPSFDGNNLPSTRQVNKEGFNATWNFNKANLPFSTVLKDFTYDLNSVAFGVTMVQPADAYSKTDRSIKYAILFIGLTFSLFFIIELMQKKSLHPVQYVLIGLALVIFYTLLLSFSEFIAFDFAYLIAALATILLITFYAYSHFKSIRTALIFGVVLSMLYGFTFVLIRLEDAALLLGSIGLFVILALAMYASRKINWYGDDSNSGSNNNINQTIE